MDEAYLCKAVENRSADLTGLHARTCLTLQMAFFKRSLPQLLLSSMKMQALSLLLWVRENATSRSETSKRILLPGMNVLQQLSNLAALVSVEEFHNNSS
jgi:hypothetical protein